MEIPKIAQKGPYETELKEGDKKAWCSCGYSEKQPFCDGSHAKKETGMKPVIFKCEKSETAYLCGCKHSKNAPFCDGTHKTL